MRFVWFRSSLVLLASLVTTSASSTARTEPGIGRQGPGPTAPRLDRADLEAWLDGLVPYALGQADIAGLVISVVKDGRVLLEKGYGYADVARRVPMDPERTVVRGASLSKSFTATAVMQQVEQGKLALDRDVNAYLDFVIPPAFGRPITLRHLLTHTAGFAEIAYQRYVPPLPLRQHVRKIPERIYPPGEVSAYSNYGLNLAGYIVERVSGEPIADYVERHVLLPLGMTRSTFHTVLPDDLAPLEAKDYALASSGEPFESTLIAELSPDGSPTTGLATTAHDMTRFMLAELQHGRLDDYRMLTPEALGEMQAPSFVPMPGAQPVALGLFRSDYRGHRIIGHSGDGEGVHTGMSLLLDEGVGIFTAQNSDGTVDGMFPAAFTLRTRLIEQLVDRYFPVASAPEEPTVPTAKEHARLAAGEYVWSRRSTGDFQEAFFLIVRFLGLETAIRANPDGTIEATPSIAFEKTGRSQTWREVGPFVWREVGGDAHLVMKVRDGEVQSVWSDAVPSFWVNLRVPFVWSAKLNVPLLLLALGALLLTVVLWPVRWLVRRRYGRPMELDDRARRAYRLTGYATLVGVLYGSGWAIAMAADAASSVAAKPWIRLLQVIGLLCAGGAAIAVWNAWLTWRSARPVGARVWSLVLASSMLYLVWFSFAFHLISVRLS